jgi:VanZ family protein
MSDSRLRSLSLLMALTSMGLLFYLSHQPSLPTPSLFPAQDKIIHALAYGALAVMLLGSYPLRADRYSWQQIGASVVIASLYGASDELHQSFVPGRNPEIGDWLADTLGALIAVLLVAWLVKNRHALKPAAQNKSL